jgi:hypothetical protein
MTSWLGVIVVVFAYLADGAVLVGERFHAARAVIDDACRCGCDVYNQEEDTPLEVELTDEAAEYKAQRDAVIRELSAWWALPPAVNR